jgi:hypothetical protein
MDLSPWWQPATTIEAQKQVFNRGYQLAAELSAPSWDDI